LHTDIINQGKTSANEKVSGMKVAAISLGCSKNRVDTEEILGFLSNLGFILTDDYRLANIILVNTCSFIEQAQQESIDTLLEVAMQIKKSNTKLIVAGCLVELFGSKLINTIPEIDGAIGVHSYRNLKRLIKMVLNNKRAVFIRKPAKHYSSLSPRILTTPAHSANVKIAEGCSNCCHYCLIPKIRGHYRSRYPGEIIAEIKYLLENGTREINLIAQDTTSYGSDQADIPDLAGLIEKILELEGNYWLRIMYTYPSRIDPKLIDLIASEKRICNYLDIPIQHVNDHVLTKMARSYTKEDVTALINKLRSRIPELALRTTFLIGYPDEKRRQFEELISFIGEYPFERLGAFAYSVQKGTVAGNSLSQVPQRVINRRRRELMAKQQLLAHQLNLGMIGKRLVLLVDRIPDENGKWYYGRNEYQAPDIDGGVYFRSTAPLKQGDWVSVKICAASPYNLLAARPVLLGKLPA